MKKLTYLILIIATISSCTSSADKKEHEKRKSIARLLVESATKLSERGIITQDSLQSILTYFGTINNQETAEQYAKHLDSLSKLKQSVLIPKMSDKEYYNYFHSKYDQIKLEKLYGQAPLYGEYADKLMAFLEEVIQTDQTYQILKIKEVNDLYQKAERTNKAALISYGKYGDLDKNPVVISSICQVALKDHLNDPDFEVVRENYYLKQTGSGYQYKLTIRAKNHFGAVIMKEINFNLKYNSIEKNHYVASIQE